MELIPVVDGLYLVPGENGGRFPLAHSILVDGPVRALIDTGCGSSVVDSLISERPVDMVICSHCHPDHTALNWKFADVPLYMPDYGAESLGDWESLARRFTGGGRLGEIWRHYVQSAMNFRPSRPTHTFADGHVFDFGKISFTVIHTPGHTIDHTCFFDSRQGILLSFDIDLTSFGPWYGHTEGDISAFEDSIHKVMALNPEVVISSHKGVIRDNIADKMQRFLQVFDDRDRILLDLIPQVRTEADLVAFSPFYRSNSHSHPLVRYWEEQMVHKHLERLGERGLIPHPLPSRFTP